MKLFFFILTLLPLTLNAASIAPRPRQDIPEMDWVVRPMVRGGAVLPAKELKRMYSKGVDVANSLADREKLAEMIQATGEFIVHLSNISEEQAAMEAIDYAFNLLALQKSSNRDSTMSVGAAVSFVLYPSSVEALKTPLPLDNFRAFSNQVYQGMRLQQDAYLNAPPANRKWYFLGAVGNSRISSKGSENDLHLQLILGLKEQSVVQGSNTIVIPQGRVADEMPVAIVDVSMPIELTFPQIEISFGTLGQLQPTRLASSPKTYGSGDEGEWRLKFAPNPGVGCSRAWSVPQVRTTMNGVAVNVPVYSVTVDGNEQLLTGAHAGFGGFGRIGPLSFEYIGCGFDVPVLHTVSNKFKTQVNEAITNSMFRDLLGLSLLELSERVKNLKLQEETKNAQN